MTPKFVNHADRRRAASMPSVASEIMLAHVVVCPAILVIHIQNVAPNVSTTMIAQSRRPVSTTNAATHVSAFAVRIQSVKW